MKCSTIQSTLPSLAIYSKSAYNQLSECILTRDRKGGFLSNWHVLQNMIVYIRVTQGDQGKNPPEFKIKEAKSDEFWTSTPENF